MDLTRIISITGRPGLFELISQTKGGFIVKDLVTQKKLSISANSQVSLLQNISIYTQEAEVPLASILINISKVHKYSEVKFTKSDSKNLRALIVEVQPDYAAERVYDSDLKKLFSWYNILVKNSIITQESIKALEEAIAETEEEIQQEQEQPPVKEKPVKKETKPKEPKATAKKVKEEGEKKETKTKKTPKKSS